MRDLVYDNFNHANGKIVIIIDHGNRSRYLRASGLLRPFKSLIACLLVLLCHSKTKIVVRWISFRYVAVRSQIQPEQADSPNTLFKRVIIAIGHVIAIVLVIVLVI